MFDTPVINVAIGLVFCFAATALAASTLTEALASLVKLRANSLVSGVQQMLNDPQFNGLAQAVYNHALVHPQGDGAMQERSRFWTYSGPSYIKAGNFATAMVDVLQKVPGDVAQLKANIDALPDAQIKQLLNGMLVRAKGDVDQLQQHIAGWFDTAMDRVSGAYKRKAQVISFLSALLLAVTINVDATHVVSVLWANPALARGIADKAVTADASITPADAMKQLTTLPVGPQLLEACNTAEWSCVFNRRITGYNLLGWLITAVAAVFGAPFWFDMLGRLAQLRGAGPKPGAPGAPAGASGATPVAR
jgi:hypothetical protein